MILALRWNDCQDEPPVTMSGLSDLRYWAAVGEHGHLAMKPTSAHLTNRINLLQANYVVLRNLFMSSRTHHRFICTGCGTDWMTVLSEAEAAGLCQRCYHMRQMEYVEWVR